MTHCSVVKQRFKFYIKRITWIKETKAFPKLFPLPSFSGILSGPINLWYQTQSISMHYLTHKRTFNIMRGNYIKKQAEYSLSLKKNPTHLNRAEF